MVLSFPYDLVVKVKQWLSQVLDRFRIKYGKMGYAYARLHALPMLAIILILLGAVEVGRWSVEDVLRLWVLVKRYRVVALFWSVAAICGVICYMRSPHPVYLLDFSCYRPGSDQKCNYELSEYVTRRSQMFTIPSMEFQRKILVRSGLGDETYVPPYMFRDRLVPTFQDARLEAEQVMFGSVDELLNKTGVKPRDISILVSNCSLFNPTPSLSAMLVNRCKMREDVKTIQLGGMGCSASVIACNLAKDLLKTRPNQYALVVSTENMTSNWYFGNQKSMLLTNCLFRVGCAAVLLTNKRRERCRSNYELLHCVRTHKAADDRAYRCAFQTEDEEGTLVGVALNKDLMGVAADAIRTNIVRLSPYILPLAEQFFFIFSLLCRKLLKMKAKQYQPDFKLAVQHFCLHAGGRAVIDEIQKNLHLSDYLMEPARATLHRFGNTSASCLWYVFAYMEAKQRIKKGDKVWMLGLGSGFKCNSAIWRAIHDIPMPTGSPWSDCIHRYPEAFVK